MTNWGLVFIEIAWGVLMISHVFMWLTVNTINRTIALLQTSLKNQMIVNDQALKTVSSIIEGQDLLSKAVKKMSDVLVLHYGMKP